MWLNSIWSMRIVITPVRGQSGWQKSFEPRSKQLAGIHDSVRIQRLLNRAHGTQCCGRGVALQLSALEAAEAGAAIAHIHVRNPETGKAARDPKLYAQVVEHVRASGVDVVLNLTAGMGGDVVFGAGEVPLPLDPTGTDMVGPRERLAESLDAVFKEPLAPEKSG